MDITLCSEPEKVLLQQVILPTLSIKAEEYIHPQYPFEDSEGKRRRIDFAIITKQSKLAIELDGYTYHAEGQVTEAKFSDDLTRQNELILAGWKVIRFSWRQVNNDTERCRDILRRSAVGDPELHPSLSRQTIRPHVVQEEVLERLRNARAAGMKRGLVVMATGLGKTFLSAFDAKAVGGKVLFIVHNNSILEQAKKAFRAIFPDATLGLYNGYTKEAECDIVFANIHTLRTRLESFRPDEFQYIIVDEFHHGATQNYVRVIKYFTPKFLLGLTATPNRTDNKSILAIVDNNLIYQITQREAIDRGFLSPFHYYAYYDDIDYSDIKHNGFRYDLVDLNKKLVIQRRDDSIIRKFMEVAPHSKAIGFCVSIEHTVRAAEHFRDRGIRAVAIHSGMSQEYRNRLIEDFRRGDSQVVFVRDIFNEGIDFPEVETLLFLRPTESKIIFTQQLGRGLRLNAGKQGVKVLDFIGNYLNADKIIDYIGEASGIDLSLENLKKKPVYYYDNGCEVNFDQQAVDTIALLNPHLINTAPVVDDFFQLIQFLGRVPTISEIQMHGKYKMKDYIEKYGSWGQFLDHIRSIDPKINLESLTWPASISGTDLDEYANVLDSNFDEFIDVVQRIAGQLSALRRDMDAIRLPIPGSAKRRTNKMIDLLHEMKVAAGETLAMTKHAAIILSFKIVKPLHMERKPMPLSAANEDIQQTIDALTSYADLRECYVFPRMFYTNAPVLEAFAELANGEEARIDEGLFLESIYASLPALDKLLGSVRELAHTIIVDMDPAYEYLEAE